MENSPKLPGFALGLAAILALFTTISVVMRFTSGGTSEAGAAASGCSGPAIPNGTYGGSRFCSETVEQKVEVNADPSGAIRWDKAEYTAPAGDVTFVVKNPSPITHQFGVEGGGIKYESPNFNSGTTNTYTIKGLKPGEYQIVCNFPGHKEAGMVAKLIVK